jgi:Flp pilus assembly protein TadB
MMGLMSMVISGAIIFVVFSSVDMSPRLSSVFIILVFLVWSAYVSLKYAERINREYRKKDD